MAKPIIKTITPPDANSAFNINFIWNGERAYYNRVVITNNKTNVKVYDQKVESYNMYHTVPAGTLTNGGTWVVQVSVFYKNPSDTSQFIESEQSEKKIFLTLTTPTFSFAGLDPSADNKVTTSSYQASINYISKENELVESYMFSLYDVTQRFMFETDRISDSYNISYTYRGLDNMADYYIRCRAVTKNGVELDTGLVRIHVKFENPSTYSRIYATPLPTRGCIEVGSNLIVIEYTGDEEFEFSDSHIILTDKTLYYDEGWELTDDFTVIIKMKYVEYGKLLKLSNGTDDIILESLYCADEKTRFRLTAANGDCKYILHSTGVIVNYEDTVVVGIHRKSGVYQLRVITDSSESTGDYWWGDTMPTTAEDYDNWINTSGTTTKKSYDDLVETIGGSEPSNGTNNDLWISDSNT